MEVEVPRGTVGAATAQVEKGAACNSSPGKEGYEEAGGAGMALDPINVLLRQNIAGGDGSSGGGYVAAHAMTPDATTLSKAATEAVTTLTSAVSTLVPEDPEGQTALEAPRPGSLEKTDRLAERDDSRATELLDTLDLELHDARP